ncbi:hypothetical protein QTP86_032108, partial [Hemibagrus guttatus]
EDSFELHSVDLELEAVEKQIRDLQVKQAQLRQRKAALESSQTDAHLSQVNSRRETITPTTSTPCASLPRPSARTRPAQVSFTPAPGYHAAWMQQQRKTRAKPRARTSPPPPPPVFEISTQNRFAPLRETECDTVIIGDSIVRHVRATAAKGKVHTCCLPGARVLDVSAQVPAILKKNIGAVVLHAGTNDIRLRQMEILKKDFRSLVELYFGRKAVHHCIVHEVAQNLTHLDNKDSYIRMLFIDFSSAFNTIIPQYLIEKLNLLGLNTFLCNWILDFLTGRPQSVRIGNSLSSTTTLNTGAPQGCVLSPLLFTLLIHDCAAMHSSNHITKFADDTTMVGLISNNDESAYREEVQQLTAWCKANSLSLNVDKTKEMVVDFRTAQSDHPLLFYDQQLMRGPPPRYDTSAKSSGTQRLYPMLISYPQPRFPMVEVAGPEGAPALIHRLWTIGDIEEVHKQLQNPKDRSMTHSGLKAPDDIGANEITPYEVHLGNSFLNRLKEEITRKVKDTCITWDTGKLSLIEQHAIHAEKLLNLEK